MNDPDAFHVVLHRFMVKTDRFPAALSKLSGVSRRSIENWAEGKARPRRRGGLMNLLKMAAAFPLNEPDTDLLLVEVPHPKIAVLRDTARKSSDQDLLKVLAPWDPDGKAVPPDVLLQLRAPTADFVGRVQETEHLVGWLGQAAASGAIAAISGVRGMGGIGKTELAYVVGQQLKNLFPDAQLVIDLQGSRLTALAPEQVLQTIISAFFPGEKLSDDLPSLTTRYRTVLTGKRVFILADDVRDAEQVLALLPPSGSALLLTSRFRFQLPGMVDLDLEELSEAEAIQLLQKIAPAILDVAAKEITKLCGNLPLALRVVAGITKKTSRELSEYVTLLRDERERLNRMVDKRASLDVEATISLSYRLLGLEEQKVLKQLGVFAPDFDRRAAKMIISVDENADLVGILDTLLEVNLLEYDTKQQRYQLHELVRIFAIARLAEGGEERQTRLRYTRHYVQIATEIGHQYMAGGGAIVTGLTLFDRERAHFGALWTWLQSESEDSEVAELLVEFARQISIIGLLRYRIKEEYIPLLNAAIDASRRLRFAEGECELLNALGTAYFNISDVQHALVCHQQGLVIAREEGHYLLEGNSLGNIGICYNRMGDPRRAIELYEEALVIYENIGAQKQLANQLSNLGLVYTSLSEYSRSRDLHRKALHIRRFIGDLRGVTISLNNLGITYTELGRSRRAITLYYQALVLSQSMKDRLLESRLLGNLGIAFDRLQDVSQAVVHFEQQIAIARSIDDHQGAATAVSTMADAYAHAGKLEPARELYQEAIQSYHRIGSRLGEAVTRWNLGDLLEREGDLASAILLKQFFADFLRENNHPDLNRRQAQVDVLRQTLRVQTGDASAGVGTQTTPADDLM